MLEPRRDAVGDVVRRRVVVPERPAPGGRLEAEALRCVRHRLELADDHVAHGPGLVPPDAPVRERPAQRARQRGGRERAGAQAAACEGHARAAAAVRSGRAQSPEVARSSAQSTAFTAAAQPVATSTVWIWLWPCPARGSARRASAEGRSGPSSQATSASSAPPSARRAKRSAVPRGPSSAASPRETCPAPLPASAPAEGPTRVAEHAVHELALDRARSGRPARRSRGSSSSRRGRLYRRRFGAP